MDINDLTALMGDNIETEEARDLWIIDLTLPVPETRGSDGERLIGEARRLADSLGAYVHYIGSIAADDAIAYGADRVHPLDISSADEAVAALAAFLATHRPEFIFLPASTLGDEIAGRLAHRLMGGALYNCLAIRLDESTRELTGTIPVYDGAYYLDVAVTAKPAIVTVQPNAFPAPFRDSYRSGETEAIEAAVAETRLRALGQAHHTPPPVPLHKAAKVLAIGRAGNDSHSVEVAKQIAERLGAHLAGDRSAFDSGWITKDQIVGVVGTEIAPKLYIAAGIWGDTLHRAGIEGAQYIIAIHPDPKAPIFKYADACIVGKPKDILPQLQALL
jgi:electron transfer flavoprotein alpha subunit